MVTPEPSGLTTPDSRFSGNATAKFSQYLTNGSTKGQEIFREFRPLAATAPDGEAESAWAKTGSETGGSLKTEGLGDGSAIIDQCRAAFPVDRRVHPA
jgi:hypothetical protein